MAARAFPGHAKGAGIAPGPLGSALVFRDVLVEVHEDAGSLGTGGGAARLQGAVVVAVDELIAVGPGYSPYSYIVPVEEKGKLLLVV